MNADDIEENSDPIYYEINPDMPPYFFFKVMNFAFNIYPNSFRKRDICKSFILVHLMQIFFLATFAFGGIYDLFFTIQEGSDDICENLVAVISTLGINTSLEQFFLQCKRWATLFYNLSHYDKFGKPPNFEKGKRKLDLLCKGLMIYCFFGTLVYAMISHIETDCSKITSEYKLCGTLTPYRLPFKVSHTVKNMIYFMQILLIEIALGTGLLVYYICFAATELLIFHINFVKEKIIQVFEDEFYEQKVREIAIYHKFIIKMGQELNFLVKRTLGHMTLLAAITLGCILNQAVSNYNPYGAAMFFLGMTVSLFLICHSGQRLLDSSVSIAETVFESNWVRGSKSSLQSLMILVTRSRQQLTLEALPIGQIDYMLFIMFLKTSYSYMTLLQNSTHGIEEEN